MKGEKPPVENLYYSMNAVIAIAIALQKSQMQSKETVYWVSLKHVFSLYIYMPQLLQTFAQSSL